MMIENIQNDANIPEQSALYDYDLIIFAKMLSSGSSFREMLALTSSIMKAPVIVTGPFNVIEASFGETDDPDWNSCISKSYYDPEKMKYKEGILAAHIREYFNSLYCLYESGNISNRDKKIIKTIAWLLFKSRNIHSGNAISSEKGQLLFQALENNNSAVLKKAYELKKISLPLPYQMFAAYAPTKDIQTAMLSSFSVVLKTEIMTIFGDFICGMIKPIWGESKCQTTREIRVSGFQIGISNVHDDIENCKVAADQAIKALKESKKGERRIDIASYPAYLAEDIFYQYESRFSTIEDHPVIQILEKHDADNNSDLLETLESYVNCGGNASTVAQELFVHRSTVNYRLNQIKTLTDYNIEDGSNQALLKLAFQIYRYNL